MLSTDAVPYVPQTRDGVEGWFYPGENVWLPRIAGADDGGGGKDGDAGDAGAGKESKDGDEKDGDEKDGDKGATGKEGDGAGDDELGDKGKAAINAERKRAREEKKRADAAEKKLKDREDADADETEKAKKRADEAESKVSTATDKLRKANLITALADEGLTGSKAKAAARLLDDLEYDDDDEPTNLQDAIKAATAEYGEEMFKGAKPKPKPSNIDGGAGSEDRDGPKLTADELAAAKAAGMTPEEYVTYSDLHPKLPDKTKK